MPGHPDITFPGLRTALFVHGCFWHRHVGCRFAYTPKSNIEFWNAKFQGNVTRDLRSRAALEDHGWLVLVVWECDTERGDFGGLKESLTARRRELGLAGPERPQRPPLPPVKQG
jgi:DNA mismatch endonuclease (patch repair protein)